MRIRSTGLALFAGLSIFVAACSSSGAARRRRRRATAAPPSAAPSVEASASAVRPRRPRPLIRTSRSASSPTSGRSTTRTTTSTRTRASRPRPQPSAPPPRRPSSRRTRRQYATLIQAFVDQGFNIIVTVGFNRRGRHRQPRPVKNPTSGSSASTRADLRQDGRRPGLHVPLPDSIRRPSPRTTSRSTSRKTRPATSPGSSPRPSARAARSAPSAARPCARRASATSRATSSARKSVNPTIVVKTAYVTERLLNAAFNDPAGGKKFAQSVHHDQNKVDVLFQVAGKTGNGVLDAACDANIYGVGVDVDQALSYPNAAKCIVTSAEKHSSSRPGRSSRSSPPAQPSGRRRALRREDPGHRRLAGP